VINIIQTAIEQGWTIGELNMRIKEQSSLNDNQVLDIATTNRGVFINRGPISYNHLSIAPVYGFNLTKLKEGYK